jgi:hypothetical protein
VTIGRVYKSPESQTKTVSGFDRPAAKLSTRPAAATKPETRNPKSEINPKHKTRMFQTSLAKPPATDETVALVSSL